MSSNKQDQLNRVIGQILESGILDYPVKKDYVYQKDFSVLQDFTDEELANELCRRTELGKELE